MRNKGVENCRNCKFYSKLETPRAFDGYSIYGYCFKARPYKEAYPHGLPVYIDGSKCSEYKRDMTKPIQAETVEGQISMGI